MLVGFGLISTEDENIILFGKELHSPSKDTGLR